MTVIWYSMFILLMVFIVLNLFLAIIIGGYADAKARLSTGETTLWRQVYNFGKQRMAQRQGSITLEYVMEVCAIPKGQVTLQPEQESISITDILKVWKEADDQHKEGVDMHVAEEVSIHFLQELVSDYMYYK